MKISVIIPCYNDGHFLHDAVDSVLACTFCDIEIIIINDGSTDQNTLNILDQYAAQGLKVLSQPNKGLAFSRNRGIKEASAEYILPLDADNKITPDYIKRSIELLDSETCDIVYARPFFFGEDIPERKFPTQHFDGEELLFKNYIDACSVFKKSVWEVVGGYDEAMPFPGHEDWDFWVGSFLKGFKFNFIDEALFGYRINKNSMITNISSYKLQANHDYIILKHKKEILDHIRKQSCYQKFHENDQKNYLRTSVKYLYKSFKKLIGK